MNATINRSQSLLAPKGRVPVLAPSRGDRARLEVLLSDVWTREVLPFPGVTVRARNEHLIRTSAHSMIRKLSVTSIASQFTKRSASLASITRGGSEEELCVEDELAMVVDPTLTNSSETEIAEALHLHHKSEGNTLLSAIEDDSDYPPPTIRACSSKPTSIAGSPQKRHSPRRRMRITKSPSAWQLSGLNTGTSTASRLFSSSSPTPVAAGALRPRSTNGPQIKRQASLLSRKSVRSVRSAVDGVGRGEGERRMAAELGQLDGALDFLADEKCSFSRSSSPPLTSESLNKSGVHRWSRVDFLRRGMVTHGIKGFFR